MTGFGLYAGVLLAALAESTALVGLVVPGVGVVVAASVLAARGDGSLLGVAAAATLGSVVGFGLSYHLGRAGGDWLRRWSVRAHDALEKARSLLQRHGGWAVFWGHFFGPVRACVALAAGAGGLPPGRFWTASVLGGVAWGFGLAATGAALSGGWRVLESQLGRGSLLVAAFVAVLYVSARVSVGALALGFRLVAPLSAAVLRLLALPEGALRKTAVSLHRRLPAPLRLWLVPDGATGVILSTGAAACLCLAALFFALAQGVLLQAPLVKLDDNLFHFLQTLRTPNGDHLFLWITYLGSGPVLATAAAAGTAALALLGRRFEAGLLAGGFGVGELLMWGLKHLFGRPRPLPYPFTFSETSAAFPSNHAFSSVALFGFLAYLFTRGLGSSARARLLAWTGVAVLGIGLSRLYLGAHWASDVAAGYALGGLWLSALVTGAEVRRRLDPPPPQLRPRAAAAWGAAVLAVVVTFWAPFAAVNTMAVLEHQPPSPQRRLLGASELLPRIAALAPFPVESLTGKPMGSLSLFAIADEATLRRALQDSGWKPTPALGPGALARRWKDSWKGVLAADAAVYPGFWLGHPQGFALALPAGDGTRWVARLWETELGTEDGRTVWAVRLRNELPPRLFLGVPVPSQGPRRPAPPALLTASLTASGAFARLPAPTPVEVVAAAKSVK